MNVLLILILLLFSLNSNSIEILTGKVVKVSDGDTFKILTNVKKQIKIRLSSIDCPEKKQDWGRKARKALANIIANKVVQVEKVTVDRYKRIVGKVFYDKQNINRKLVAEGHCWVYPEYNRDPLLPEIEAQARKQKLGLWKLPNPIPPWIFRKMMREKRKNKS